MYDLLVAALLLFLSRFSCRYERQLLPHNMGGVSYRHSVSFGLFRTGRRYSTDRRRLRHHGIARSVYIRVFISYDIND